MLTVGVDVGGSSVRAGLVDGDGRVLGIRWAVTPGESRLLEDAIAGLVSELAPAGQVGAVGLAVAGFVTADRRRVGFAPHLPWRDAPVAERIEQRLGLPVVLEHDANAAALAEYRLGAAAGSQVAVLLVLGTGIGGALLTGGELFRGAHGVAPELGHLRFVPDGRRCPCGKRGCWERYCSGTALGVTAAELLERRPDHQGPLASAVPGGPWGLSGRQVADAATEGDPVALEAMADLARRLGAGLALIADIYDPDVLVVGGAVARSAALFLDAATERYAAEITGAGHRSLARVRVAELGGEAGIVGAGLLARSAL